MTVLVSGISGGTSLTPPFKGTSVQNVVETSLSGCATEATSHHLSFSGKTLTGGWVASTASKIPCGGTLNGMADGSYSQLWVENNFAVPLSIPGGDTNVSVGWSVNVSLSESYSIGTSATACPTHFYSYLYNSTPQYDLNYTAGDCSTTASSEFLISGYVLDLTNGSEFAENFSSLAPCATSGGVNVCSDAWTAAASDIQEIFWESFGPGSAYCPTTAPCIVSDNYSSITLSLIHSQVRESGVESFDSNAATLAGSRTGWTFSASDHYELVYEVFGEVYSEAQAWPHASEKSTFAANPLSRGGWTVTSVAMS